MRILQAQKSQINMSHHGVGPKGAKAIAIALTVSLVFIIIIQSMQTRDTDKHSEKQNIPSPIKHTFIYSPTLWWRTWTLVTMVWVRREEWQSLTCWRRTVSSHIWYAPNLTSLAIKTLSVLQCRFLPVSSTRSNTGSNWHHGPICRTFMCSAALWFNHLLHVLGSTCTWRLLVKILAAEMLVDYTVS